MKLERSRKKFFSSNLTWEMRETPQELGFSEIQIAERPAGNVACELFSIFASLRSALVRMRLSQSNLGGSGLTSDPLSAKPTRFKTNRLNAAAGNSSVLA